MQMDDEVRGHYMKKKIAVFGNGWSNEFLRIIMDGIRRCAAENNIDIFLFMNYGPEKITDEVALGELNILRLPDLGEFDGVILLSNTFHTSFEFDYLREQILSKKVPALSVEYEIEGIDYLGTDNYPGMYELVRHLLEEHEVKKILFVSGPEGNVESECRRQATADAMEKSGLCLKEEDVVCGNWNYFGCQRVVTTYLDEHTELPDAIVCANDVMAMGICSLLEERGISVPEQVKVTGYDHLDEGVTFSPTIASVDRSWGDMGEQAVRHLLDKIAGKEVMERQLVSSRATVGESCGCETQKSENIQSDIQSRRGYHHMVDSVYFGGHLCDMANALSGVQREEELHETLETFWEEKRHLEGDDFFLCLDDNFFSSLQKGEKMEQTGYSSFVDVIGGLRDGKAIDRKRIETRCLVPDYEQDNPGSRIYVFIPLFSKKESYGYVVFGNEIPMMYDYSLNVWMRHLAQNLERVRQNIRLAELNDKLAVLSITDALTGIYNRLAYEKRAVPYLERCHEEGKTGVLMFSDVNKMKIINDKYGHIQGDVALRTVAKVLGETCPEDWITLRYGGDEFLTVGECAGEEQMVALRETILEKLREESEKMHLPYILKMGMGFALMSPNQDLDLGDSLKKADEAMYLVKREQHKEEI